MTRTLESLPFDPSFAGRADLLDGIEKVRAFEDPEMRRTVFDLWTRLEREDAGRKRARSAAPRSSRFWTAAAARAPRERD